MSSYFSRARACVSIIPFIALAACGGGSAGGVSSTPTPTSAGSGSATSNPTTATTSTTTTTTTVAATSAMPTPSTSNSKNINYNDSEYQLSNVATKANALTAYSNGATGAGVKIAILDSGLTDVTGQFAGRIDSASRDMVSSRGITDEAGHGTSVAAVAAAGRNGSDVMGVAFDATLLVARTDTVGSCAASTGCSHSDDTLAKAVDYARANGAKVINMSLGGSTPNSTLINAVRNATSAGIVVVISAGNDGAAAPDAFAQMAAQSGMNGLVVIAGSHDASFAMSSFSNRAGSYGQYYLTALGEAVRGFNHTGNDFLFSGTSYSAPAIAGAIAVLEQAFPTLSPKQVVDLLFSTATDAGDAGVDSTFGHGVLNIAKAFQPQGSLSLAGSTTTVSLETNAVLSPAMGDAVGKTGASLAQTVILDGYGRAFHVNLGSTIGQTGNPYGLASSLVGSIRSTNLGQGPVAVSINAFTNSAGQPAADVLHLNMANHDMQVARLLSGRVMARVSRTSQAVFGFGESTGRLSAMLEGRVDMPFLVARDSDATPSFAQRKGNSFAFRHDAGKTGLTVAAEKGTIAAVRGFADGASSYQTVTVGADRRFGPLSLSLAVGAMRETDTVLGSRFSAAFGGGGAITKLVDSRFSLNLSETWSVSGAFRQAWTNTENRGSRVSGSLRSSAFSAEIAHMGRESHLGLRVAQPLRVASGSYVLNLPNGYDYASGAVTYGDQRLDLSPKGREINGEATYGRHIAGGWIDANVYMRIQPGNVATAPTETGAALRFSARF